MSILALGSVDIISHKSSKASNLGNIPKTNRHIQISFFPQLNVFTIVDGTLLESDVSEHAVYLLFLSDNIVWK